MGRFQAANLPQHTETNVDPMAYIGGPGTFPRASRRYLL